jgi:hypothetical protein
MRTFEFRFKSIRCFGNEKTIQPSEVAAVVLEADKSTLLRSAHATFVVDHLRRAKGNHHSQTTTVL